MFPKYEALPRTCIFEVVRVYQLNLDKWLDKCDAALKATRYLEKMHGKNAKQEAEIALRYARAIGDKEAAEAFEIILNCIDIEQASKAAH